jgi:hypothetical protein
MEEPSDGIIKPDWSKECGCYRCAMERAERDEADGKSDMYLILKYSRMYLCETCGNKRCPHATDHRLTCTHSNAPGQKGSMYE